MPYVPALTLNSEYKGLVWWVGTNGETTGFVNPAAPGGPFTASYSARGTVGGGAGASVPINDPWHGTDRVNNLIHTYSDPYQWFMLDLGEQYAINRASIRQRGDDWQHQHQKVAIAVSNTGGVPHDGVSLQPGWEWAVEWNTVYYSLPSTPPYGVWNTSPVFDTEFVRYVAWVQTDLDRGGNLGAYRYFTLAEVELWTTGSGGVPLWQMNRGDGLTAGGARWARAGLHTRQGGLWQQRRL